MFEGRLLANSFIAPQNFSMIVGRLSAARYGFFEEGCSALSALNNVIKVGSRKASQQSFVYISAKRIIVLIG